MTRRIPYFVCIAIALLLSATVGSPLAAQDPIVGNWEGYIDLQNNKLGISIQIYYESDTLSGSIDIPQQLAQGIPLQNIQHLTGDSLRFEFPAGPGLAKFRGAIIDPDSIGGTFTQRGMRFPFVLRRSSPVSVNPTGAAASQDSTHSRFTEEDLTIVNDSVTIGGTLTLPRQVRPQQTLILISGSGEQDRHVNIFGFRIFREIAHQLAKKGIAVFRYDDRGSGSSTGSLSAATLDDLAGDLNAIIDRLSDHPRTSGTPMGLLGHSMGGMVAVKTSLDNPTVAFLVLMATPALPMKEIITEQIRSVLKLQGKSEEEIAENITLQRRVYRAAETNEGWAEVKELLKEKYRDEIRKLDGEQRKEIGDIDAFVERLAKQQITQVKSPIFRSLVSQDTGEEITRLDVPVLALFGEKDMQVLSESNSKTMRGYLAQSGTEYRLHTIASANHLFQRADSGLPSEYATLEPAFKDGVIDLIAEWITGIK